MVGYTVTGIGLNPTLTGCDSLRKSFQDDTGKEIRS